MGEKRAILSVTAGANMGDSIGIEFSSCRLIGRHLSENETMFIDRYGNRGLDSETTDLLSEHFKKLGDDAEAQLDVTAFARGPDVILADDSISRAHAMIFFDSMGLGVIDLASTNGTLVNDELIISTFLQEGDLVVLGNSHLRVSLPS